MASGLFEFSRHLSSFWVRTGSLKKTSQISSCVDGATSDADHSKTREANFWEPLYVSNDKESVLPTKQVVGCITNDTCRQQVSCTISVAINEARIASKPNIIRLFFVSDCRLLQWSITSQSWKRIGQNDDKSVTYIQGNFNEVRTTKIYPFVYSHIHVSIPMQDSFFHDLLSSASAGLPDCQCNETTCPKCKKDKGTCQRTGHWSLIQGVVLF